MSSRMDGTCKDGMMTRKVAPNITRRSFSLLSLLAAVLVALPLLSGSLAAATLDELRAAGKIGERYDGYAVARDSAVADTVKEINDKRRKIYEAQAQKQKVSVEAVGAVYAGEIWDQVPAGTWLLTADGEWKKK